MIITFGSRHHAQDGTVLRDRFVTVEGPDPLACRMHAFTLFGAKWGFLYSGPEAAGVERFGLREFLIPARGWLAHSIPAHRNSMLECDACLHLDENGVRRERPV